MGGGLNVEIDSAEWMPSWTVRFVSVDGREGDAAHRVLMGRDRFKVRGVDAVPYTAEVV